MGTDHKSKTWSENSTYVTDVHTNFRDLGDFKFQTGSRNMAVLHMCNEKYAI